MRIMEAEPQDLDVESLRACGFDDPGRFHELYPDGRYATPENDASDDDLIDFYLHGMCVPFALALHRRTGWQLAGLYTSADQEQAPMHVVCIDPDGGVADARGTGMDLSTASAGMGGANVLLPMTATMTLRFRRHPGLHRLAEGHLDRLLPSLTVALAP